jgi:SAM-dependent methyltransferase
MSGRADHEIVHGAFLASNNTEMLWGWGTPSGRVRAKRRARFIEEGARLGPHSYVLEIGCGTGLFTEILALTRARIVAVDISQDLLNKARERGLPKDRVCFLEKRFEDCVVDGPFDAIVGSSILHHLEIEEAFRKMFELLRPGGVISFAEPNMLNPQVFAERKFRKFFPYVSPDETAFVRWPLKRLIRKTGFTDIEIKPFDWLHPGVPRSLIGLVSSAGRLLESLPVLREFSGSLYIRAARPSE